MGNKNQIFHISSILEGVFGNLNLSKRLKQQQALKLWTDIVGVEISAVTWPLELHSKKLRILVTDPIWMQQLSFLEPKIIEKINNRLSVTDNELIEKIYFQLGVPPRSTEVQRPNVLKGSIELSHEEHTLIHDTVNNLSNNELREILIIFFKKATLASKKRRDKASA